MKQLAKLTAKLPLFNSIRTVHRSGKTDLPVVPKMLASAYAILEDYGNGDFPVVYDKDTIYKSEANYVANDLEPVESDIRSPFKPGARPYMNRNKMKAIYEAFNLCDIAGLKHGDWMLELGAGTGWLSELMCLRGYHVTCTTLSPDDTRVMRLRAESLSVKQLDTYMHCITCGMEEIEQYVHKKFNAVLIHGALHHAYDWRASIQAMERLLVPGGHIMLCDEPSWWHTLICHRSSKIQGRHEIGFFKGELLSFIRQQGFEIVHFHRSLTLAGGMWICAKKL